MRRPLEREKIGEMAESSMGECEKMQPLRARAKGLIQKQLASQLPLHAWPSMLTIAVACCIRLACAVCRFSIPDLHSV